MDMNQKRVNCYSRVNARLHSRVYKNVGTGKMFTYTTFHLQTIFFLRLKLHNYIQVYKLLITVYIQLTELWNLKTESKFSYTEIVVHVTDRVVQ